MYTFRHAGPQRAGPGAQAPPTRLPPPRPASRHPPSLPRAARGVNACGPTSRPRAKARMLPPRPALPRLCPPSGDSRAHKIHPQRLPDRAPAPSYSRESERSRHPLPSRRCSERAAAARLPPESSLPAKSRGGRRRRGRRGVHTASLRLRLRAATADRRSALPLRVQPGCLDASAATAVAAAAAA
jgi:hypothetical protein